MTISLCMIVKNEEETLARCLDSVRDAVDEIVIVDTGSTDATREIAARYTPIVESFEWIDNFSAARNASFDLASGDFLLWLDADDVVPPGELAKLIALKDRLTATTGTVMMLYHVAFDSEGRPTMSYYRERLVQRRLHPRWKGAVHEAIEAPSPIEYSDIAVHHKKLHVADPNRNLRIFEGLLAQGRSLAPREQYYYGRELCDHGRYQEAAAVLEHFLNQDQGWIENKIGACLDLARCRQELNEPAKALEALLASLRYGAPKALACCRLGGYFLAAGQLEAAIFWYESALRLKDDATTGAFVEPEASGYYPLMQLCLCYDRLGRHETACRYNEQAGALKPGDPAYLYNKAYFQRILPDPRDTASES